MGHSGDRLGEGELPSEHITGKQDERIALKNPLSCAQEIYFAYFAEPHASPQAGPLDYRHY